MSNKNLVKIIEELQLDKQELQQEKQELQLDKQQLQQDKQQLQLDKQLLLYNINLKNNIITKLSERISLEESVSLNAMFQNFKLINNDYSEALSNERNIIDQQKIKIDQQQTKNKEFMRRIIDLSVGVDYWKKAGKTSEAGLSEGTSDGFKEMDKEHEIILLKERFSNSEFKRQLLEKKIFEIQSNYKKEIGKLKEKNSNLEKMNSEQRVRIREFEEEIKRLKCSTRKEDNGGLANFGSEICSLEIDNKNKPEGSTSADMHVSSVELMKHKTDIKKLFEKISILETTNSELLKRIGELEKENIRLKGIMLNNNNDTLSKLSSEICSLKIDNKNENECCSSAFVDSPPDGFLNGKKKDGGNKGSSSKKKKSFLSKFFYKS